MNNNIITSLAILGILSYIAYVITFKIHKKDSELVDNKDVRIVKTIMYGLFILFGYFSLSFGKHSHIYKIIQSTLGVPIVVLMIILILRSYNIIQIDNDQLIIFNKTLNGILWTSIIIDILDILYIY